MSQQNYVIQPYYVEDNVYIFVFKVNRPHEEDDIVTFIDFSNASLVIVVA